MLPVAILLSLLSEMHSKTESVHISNCTYIRYGLDKSIKNQHIIVETTLPKNSLNHLDKPFSAFSLP